MATGIEYVIARAALNGRFRRRLLSNRELALSRLGNRLSPADRAALMAIPKEQLHAMIEGTGPRLPARRSLIARVLACLGIVGGLGTTSCIPIAGGIRPDEPDGESEPPVVTGIRPDEPK